MIELDSNIDFTQVGPSFLEYAPTNSGKTASALTAEDPILFIHQEYKDPRLVHQDIGHQKKIKYVKFESFYDQQDNLNALYSKYQAGDRPYKTIFYDGLTFSQQGFRHDLEDSRKGARMEEADARSPYRGLIDDFRFEKPDWGSIGSIMARTTGLLTSFSDFGVVVICTALEDSNYPKWGKGMRIGPAFVGQDYPKLIAGYFHFIGYIVQPFRLAVDGTPILPRISFDSITDPESSNDYVARSSSITLSKAGPAPLNWSKILKVIRQGSSKPEIKSPSKIDSNIPDEDIPF